MFEKWMYQQYKDAFFEPDEAFERYKKDGYPCGKVAIRAFRNWIKTIADKIEKGKWKIKNHILEKYKESLT